MIRCFGRGRRGTRSSSTFAGHVEYGGEQGLLGLAFHPSYAAQPALVRRVHVDQRAEHGGPLPLGRHAKRVPSSRKFLLAVPRSVRRTTTAGTWLSDRTGACTRASGTAAPEVIPRTGARTCSRNSGSCSRSTSTPPHVEAGSSAEIVGARAEESVALLVRSLRTATSTSATSARTRSRRSTSHRARARGSRTTAGTCTKERTAPRRTSPRSASSCSPCRVRARWAAARSPAGSSTAGRPPVLSGPLRRRRLLQRARPELPGASAGGRGLTRRGRTRGDVVRQDVAGELYAVEQGGTLYRIS